MAYNLTKQLHIATMLKQMRFTLLWPIDTVSRTGESFCGV